ncbi:MAG: radical SAM protein [Candidatus Cloacimonas sp.]|jgi:MoaA/NifB/PqqE/SkfB family radical SAM enzyme|nr:radical SAM protein [Candidatus Cloacimonas sp.]
MPNLSTPERLITGFQCQFILFLLKLNILWLALVAYRNPLTAFRTLKAVIAMKKAVDGDKKYPRLVKSGGRYFWAISCTGWPSLAFNRFIRGELNKICPIKHCKSSLQTMIFSITSRCPLHCEHCYEWENLSHTEPLSTEQLLTILKKFQCYGIANIQFSGGEPLSRFDDLLLLLKSAEPGADFWILTSGYELTAAKAQSLKQAGLTGVVISLDHWDEAKHNAFRGNAKSFFWVQEAAKNAAESGLAVAFSLCAGRDFVSEENLDKYLRLTKAWGALQLRILEPRQVGHYQGKNIELEAEQIGVLSAFYLKTLSDPAYRAMPIVEYVGFHQRQQGCFGAGDRYLYVDSKADIHACPFCQGAAGNALKTPLEPVIAKLKKIGCHKFHRGQGVR